MYERQGCHIERSTFFFFLSICLFRHSAAILIRFVFSSFLLCFLTGLVSKSPVSITVQMYREIDRTRNREKVSSDFFSTFRVCIISFAEQNGAVKRNPKVYAWDCHIFRNYPIVWAATAVYQWIRGFHLHCYRLCQVSAVHSTICC